MENIVAATDEVFNVDSDGIPVKGKKRNLARNVAIYLSRNHSRRSGNELGNYFGNISGAAIAVRSKTVAGRMQKDQKLKNRIRKIEGRIIKN